LTLDVVCYTYLTKLHTKYTKPPSRTGAIISIFFKGHIFINLKMLFETFPKVRLILYSAFQRFLNWLKIAKLVISDESELKICYIRT
jgi:hypothetical protein